MKSSFWDITAPFYERFMLMGKQNKLFYSKLGEMVCAPITKDMRILELAMGPAMLTPKLAEACDSLVATDYSSQMVELACKKRLLDNVTVSQMDATDIKFDSNTFDAVVIANALHIIPDPVKALAEIKRVLKSDGILIAPTFIAHKRSSLRNKLLASIGFRKSYEWTEESFVSFLGNQGFEMINKPDEAIIPNGWVNEFVAICRIS